KIAMSIQNEGKIAGLILDLRNNPGGYLTEATYVSSEFLRSGVVVIQDRGNGQETEFSVNRKGLLMDIPMVVLINKGSASAA
ncbi:MAG: S41 family peptidase, partial [Patescibacteria group bacterium]